ncbi:hypothetical protein AN958_09612 [Leucoagaricus sp. SymC.cos]|nr:hypothetical protein AN958_09612 [Leucoagaricus sp. SymC.cos]
MYVGDHTKFKALVLLIWTVELFNLVLWAAGSHEFYLLGGLGMGISHIFAFPSKMAFQSTVAVTGVLTFVVHWSAPGLLRVRRALLTSYDTVSVSATGKFRIKFGTTTLLLTFPFHQQRLPRCKRDLRTLRACIFSLKINLILTNTAFLSNRILSQTFPTFRTHFNWLFTLGLALSTAVDILITTSLFFLLKTSRTSDFDLNAVIDTLILYAFETGALTTAGTIVSMICWLAMKDNLIFMGLHFVIAKLYANSILVT